MYIIINRTTKEETFIKGGFPYDHIVELLEDDNDVVIISLYSNTIQTPYLDLESNNYNETKSGHDWSFRDSPIHIETLNQLVIEPYIS